MSDVQREASAVKRAALVTGGSSGIGLAIAGVLAMDGYDITISGRRVDELERSVARLRENCVVVQAVPSDLTHEDQIVALVDAHRDKFGRLDVLVNNAGVGFVQTPSEITAKKLDVQIAVNLRGLILATREALPMLKQAGAEHGKALIINVASIAAKKGRGWLPVYSATKAGVVGFSQATQQEHEHDGIQVTALCPGLVDTPMTDFIKGEVPSGTMLRPDDIGEAVRFVLRTSPACLVPEIVFHRPGELD